MANAVFLALLCSVIVLMVYYVVYQPSEVGRLSDPELAPSLFMDRPALCELHHALSILCQWHLCRPYYGCEQVRGPADPGLFPKRIERCVPIICTSTCAL